MPTHTNQHTMNRTTRNGSTQVTAEIELWTPELAREALAKNTRNRPLTWSHVVNLAAAMSAGEWQMNGETIKIASDGTLEDGQHRLAAVVESGVGIRVLTVRGVAKNVFDTIDLVKKRSGADILSRHREANSNVLSAALSWLWRYEHGQVGRSEKPRESQMPGLLEEHPHLRDSARLVQGTRFLMPIGISAACHYLFAKKNPEQAEAFFEKLCRGENLSRKDAVFLLREKLTKHRNKTGKLSNADIFAITIKAWNAERTGQKISRLWYRAIGTPENPAEPFPKVK